MKAIIKENKRFRVVREVEEFIDETYSIVYSRYFLQKKSIFRFWKNIIVSSFNDIEKIKEIEKEPNYTKFINLFNVISNII